MVKTPQLALHGTEEHLDPGSLDAASCFRQVSLALATTNHHKSPQIHQGWASLVRKMCLWTASHLSGKVDAFAPPVKPRGGGISALAAAASEAALRPAKGAELWRFDTEACLGGVAASLATCTASWCQDPPLQRPRRQCWDAMVFQ